MMFVQWCYDQAGLPLSCKTASCSALLRWYTQNHPECIVSTPRPGDVVIYNFGHTGILESANSKMITVIEGNTSPGNSGSQSNGGGVFRRTRKKSTVTAYIRPFPESTATKGATMTGNEIISALTDEQAYNLLLKAQRHAATLPEPAWSVNEGHWQRAKANGIINGGSPEGLVKRCEFAAVLGRKGLL